MRYRRLSSIVASALLACALGAQKANPDGTPSGDPVNTASDPGTYTLFGLGCGSCTVLPRAYASKMGQNANTFPHARANMRYQQVFLGSEIGGRQTWTSLCLRLDERFGGPAQRQRIRLRLAATSRTPANLGRIFGANYGQAPITVFDGNLSLPRHAGGGGVLDFSICMKFRAPVVYVSGNLLVEFLNLSTSALSHFEDFCFNAVDCTTSRAYAFDATAATASQLFRTQGLIMCLRGPSTGPRLTNIGLPTLGKSFSARITGARPRTAAGLITGGSRTKWGPVPLPFLLDVFGAYGCSLLVSFDTMFGFATDASGTGTVTAKLPLDRRLVGVVFFQQFLAVDLRANPLRLVFSNGGAGKIGS